MSKKRTSPESSNDEQTNEGSDSVFQQDDNARRAKRILLSDTTLQDLPMELIECILVKAVAMEVKDTKLAKSVWKEKADLVISRLGTVCSQWSNILSTNFFRNELHRTLDGTAQKTIRLEILHESPLPLHVYRMTTMKDEIFMTCRPQDGDIAISVYDRNNLAVVKDVIPLPGIHVCPECLVACSVSKSLYILYRRTHCFIKISRITKDDEHQFNIITLITDAWMSIFTIALAVAANGDIIFSKQPTYQYQVISIYNADGFLQHEIKMFPYSNIPKFSYIIPKSNGNLVLVSKIYLMQTTLTETTALTEIKIDGTILRQYQLPCNVPVIMCNRVSNAGLYERMMISDLRNRMELLDSDFNLLEFSGPQLNAKNFIYNSERNEVVTIVHNRAFQHGVLTIFRFTEE